MTDIEKTQGKNNFPNSITQGILLPQKTKNILKNSRIHPVTQKVVKNTASVCAWAYLYGNQLMNVEEKSGQMANEKDQDETHEYDGHVVLLATTRLVGGPLNLHIGRFMPPKEQVKPGFTNYQPRGLHNRV